jgi:hypothetical protein
MAAFPRPMFENGYYYAERAELAEKAIGMFKRPSYLDMTPPHQEHANPTASPAEQLQGAHAPPIDPAPSSGVQTISEGRYNGGSSPSALHSNSDTPPTTTNTGE